MEKTNNKDRKEIKNWLPHKSNEFEIKFLDFISEVSTVSKFNFLGDFCVFEIWTRVGFCKNRGCISLKDSDDHCSFIIKYKVSFAHH